MFKHDYCFAYYYEVMELLCQLLVVPQAVEKVWDWLLPLFATSANVSDPQV